MKYECERCGNEFESYVRRPRCSVCGLVSRPRWEWDRGVLSGMEVGDVWEYGRDEGGGYEKYVRCMRRLEEKEGWEFEVRISVYRIKIRRVK